MIERLLIIDPQNDFCDPKGSLFVNGADKDMERLASFIKTKGDSLRSIHVTLDSHHNFDVAHPIFWVNGKGEHPAPFTIITFKDLKKGVWKPSNLIYGAKMATYLQALETSNRYPLCIWPPHCLISSWGTQMKQELFEVLNNWELKNIKMVEMVTKGSNFLTEHYSAVKAEVPDASDPSTQLNIALIKTLENSDTIYIAGEALSHCVANTITDIADNFGDDNIKKFVLLEDCTSNVTGFENLGNDFINKMKSRGMQITKSTNF